MFLSLSCLHPLPLNKRPAETPEQDQQRQEKSHSGEGKGLLVSNSKPPGLTFFPSPWTSKSKLFYMGHLLLEAQIKNSKHNLKISSFGRGMKNRVVFLQASYQIIVTKTTVSTKTAITTKHFWYSIWSRRLSCNSGDRLIQKKKITYRVSSNHHNNLETEEEQSSISCPRSKTPGNGWPGIWARVESVI